MPYLLCCFRVGSPSALVDDELLGSRNVSSNGTFAKKHNHATYVKRKRTQGARIDELPEPCLLHLLALTPLHERVRLAALSRKWRTLVSKSLVQLTSLATSSSSGSSSSAPKLSCGGPGPQSHLVSPGSLLAAKDPALGLVALLPHCTNLRTLVLAHCVIDGQVRDAVTLNCPALEHLEIHGATFQGLLPSDFLRQVFVYSTKIRHLAVSDLSETDLAQAAAFLATLEELTVRFPSPSSSFSSSSSSPSSPSSPESHGSATVALIGGNFFSKLGCSLKRLTVEGINEMYPPALAKNSKLRASLSELTITATPLSFGTLKSLCKAFPHLRKLHVELKGEPVNCKTLFGKKMVSSSSPYSLHDLSVTVFGSPSVAEHDLKGFGDVSLHSLTNLVKNSPELRSLVLAGGFLTNDAVRKIGRHCPLLERLELRYLNKHIIKRNAELTDLCAQDIAFFLPRLKKLSLAGASLTDEGISWLLISCRSLRTLDVSGCERLTMASLDILRECAVNVPREKFVVEASGTQLVLEGDELDTLQHLPPNVDLRHSAACRKLSSGFVLGSQSSHGDDNRSFEVYNVQTPNHFLSFANPFRRTKSQTALYQQDFLYKSGG